MNYNCFLKEITQRVRERIYDGCTVEVKPVRKINGLTIDCMTIRRPSDLVCPNIYMNQIYEQYQNGCSIDQAADNILRTWQHASAAAKVDADLLLSSSIIREQVVYRLVNYEKNLTLLEEIPHRKILDLALIFYVLVHTEEMGDGAIMVRNDFLDYYSVTHKELEESALKNTRKLLPADFLRITDLLREFGEKSGAYSYKDLTLEEESSQASMYVLTNTARLFGAYYMTDLKILHQIAESLNTDLYLLPSSVHECIVVPEAVCEAPEDLACIVREINHTQVWAGEYLSDTVYRFRDEGRCLEIAS